MYAHILLPVDLDQETSWKKALPAAAAMCRTFGAKLTVMTVIPGFTATVVEQYFPPEVRKRISDEARQALDRFLQDNKPDGVDVDAVVAEGKIYQEILATAESAGADLIVMGSHSPELSDYLIGPNAARVVRHAPVSVFVVR